MKYKFRAYHKKKERLVDVLEIDFENNVVTLTIETDGDDEYYWWSSTCHLDEVELIQFTGLTDVNGVKIYEGDIITSEDNFNKGKLVYRYGCFQIKYGREKYKLLINTAYPKVIGNIYQHKHLLKENEENGSN